MRKFPRLGNFLVGLLWPYIVTWKTEKELLKFTGKRLSKDEKRELRKGLAGITHPIMNPHPHPSSGSKT